MKRIILSLLFAPLFFSCQKDNDNLPENNGPVFVSEFENNYGTFKLTYNEQNFLSKAELWTTNGYTPALFLATVVEYNYSNNKITGYSTRQGGENTPPGNPVLTTFVYDDKGHITQSVTNNVKVVDWKTDAEGKPTARLVSNGPSSEWEYTSDGNIKLKYSSTSGVGWTNTSSGSLTFNTEYNPFYTNGTGLALYAAFGYMVGGPAKMITRNLLSAVSAESLMISDYPAPTGSTTKSSTASTYTYTKDGNGLLNGQTQVFKMEEITNGVKTGGADNTYSYKFTCIRK